MREAPSRTLIDELIERGAQVVAYDPIALDEARRLYGQSPAVRFATSALAACDGADALVVVTEWKEFRSPDFASLLARLKTPVVFDGRNLFDPALIAAGADGLATIKSDRAAPADHSSDRVTSS